MHKVVLFNVAFVRTINVETAKTCEVARGTWDSQAGQNLEIHLGYILSHSVYIEY